MGVTTFTHEYSSTVAPSRMFTALIIDSRNLIPKLLPQFVKDVNIIEGDGGAGSIEQVNFNEGKHLAIKHKSGSTQRILRSNMQMDIFKTKNSVLVKLLNF